MITSKQQYRYYLESDRLALGRGSKGPGLFILDPIWSFQMLLRRVEFFSNCKNSLLWKPYIVYLKLRLRNLQIKLGFTIPINTIGPGLCIVHRGPIVIANNAKIGANLRINIGVVIGEDRGLWNVPTIGDSVTIEPGCKIFGKIQIADGIHIGANAVVNKSFLDPGIVIAGVPARKIGNNPDYSLS